MAKIQVLIIEDEAHHLAMLRRLLAPYDLDIINAVDGETGLQMAKLYRPDLIITDYRLPNKEGLDIVQELRNEQLFIPTVLITAYLTTYENIPKKALELGVMDVIKKPYSQVELLRVINHIITIIGLQREKEELMERLIEAHVKLHQLGDTKAGYETEIFVSYSHQDWDNYVQPLVKQLRGEGFKVWVDHGLIKGGDSWMDSVGRALDQSRVLLLCISPAALMSDWVRKEYRYFIRTKKRVLPLVCEETNLPMELADLHWLKYSTDTKTLIETLKGLMGEND